MGKKLSEKQKRLAEAKAKGLNDLEACRVAGYSAKNHKSASNQVGRMRENEEFCSYLEGMNKEARAGAVMTKREALEFLTEVILTPVGQVTPESRLAQEHQGATENQSEKIKMPGKLEAVRELAKIEGWYEAEKVEVAVTSVKDLIKKSRANVG